MLYGQFIQQLQQSNYSALVFQLGGITIPEGYHITEVLKAQVHSLDCGGRPEQWEETVLQLISPLEVAGKEFMPKEKALGILKKSTERLNISQASKVILEYRPQGIEAAQRFVVSEISEKDSQLMVISLGAATQCKPAAHKSSCCG